jgi:hypothetical protein
VAGEYLGIILALLLLALIPAKIAAAKGRSFVEWYIFGVLILIVAIPAAVLARDERAVCPFCAEAVKSSGRRWRSNRPRASGSAGHRPCPSTRSNGSHVSAQPATA